MLFRRNLCASGTLPLRAYRCTTVGFFNGALGEDADSAGPSTAESLLAAREQRPNPVTPLRTSTLDPKDVENLRP